MSDGQNTGGQKPGMWRRLFGGRPAEEQLPETPATEDRAAGDAAAPSGAPDRTHPAASEGTDTAVEEDRRPSEASAEAAAASGADTPVAEVAGEAPWPEDEGAAAQDDASKAPDAPVGAFDLVPPEDQPTGADADTPVAETASEPAADDALTAAPETRQGFFRRLISGLDRTSSSLTEGVTGLFTKRKLDAETLQDLEDVLIQADLGVETAMAVTERLSDARYQKGIEDDALRQVLAEEVAKVLAPVEVPFAIDGTKKPFVVLVVGVNGTGKTTTIGKIAAKLKREGRTVVLAAGDTFRAAAVEQLKIWGERTGSRVVSRPTGSDASGLVYDALEEAATSGADAILIDTAGRLQNRAELMAELEKVVRVIRKKMPEAPHAVLLVLDATTGQNALNQVEIFTKSVGVTGLVMTKLDGTARGGILVAIAARHQVPVHFVGVGEGIDDLAPFRADDFAAAIAGRRDGRG
ncbi:signal recognition particle-docking protein FtsY [Amorphus sp. MBR-141]